MKSFAPKGAHRFSYFPSTAFGRGYTLPPLPRLNKDAAAPHARLLAVDAIRLQHRRGL
jgi:hypothetical protein